MHLSFRSRRWVFSALLLPFFCCNTTIQAEGIPKLIPEYWERQPVLVIPPTRPEPPKIDGHGHFNEWKYAACVVGFFDLESGGLPPYPIRMYLCYDNDAIYVGLMIGRDPMHPTPRATFAPGPHDNIWWKDDNFELVIDPGLPSKGLKHGYVFVGNSIGGWADRRYEYPNGSDASWRGKWEYKAKRAGRDAWHAELRIPFDQFEGISIPKPGDAWRMDVMIQQVTPRKQMFDWSNMWSFGQTGYTSPNKTHIIFGGPNDPIFRFTEAGELRPTKNNATKQKQKKIGMRCLLYNQGDAYVLHGKADLFRAEEKQTSGMLNFYELWDRIISVEKTGKPLKDPKDPTQAFRTAEDLLRELNNRFKYVTSVNGDYKVKSKGAGYFALQIPHNTGNYVAGYSFCDAGQDKVLAAQVVPFSVRPNFDLILTPYFLTHQKLKVNVCVTDAPETAKKVSLRLKVDGKEIGHTTLSLPKEGNDITIYFDTSKWPEEKTGTIEAELLDGDNKTINNASESLLRPRNPSWSRQNLGSSKVVPPPFTPVKSDSNYSASVWKRTFIFSNNGLPESIIVRDKELLAAPITLDLKAGSVTNTDLEGKINKIRSNTREAVFESSLSGDNLTIQTRTDLHYDGTIRFDVELIPQGSISLDKLILQIPLQNCWANLMAHNATFTDFALASNEGMGGSIDRWFTKYPQGAMPFTYAFFLGTYDRGIQWFSPSDRGWSNKNERQKIALKKEKDKVTLVVRFVDKPVTLDKPLKLNFGLTVLPTKPDPRGHELTYAAFGRVKQLKQYTLEQFDQDMPMYKERGADAFTSYLSDGAEHFGQPWVYDKEDQKFLAQFADLLDKHGLKYRPYCGWGVSTNIPNFATFGKEMLKEPLRNAGWGCYWHNPASDAFVDWWLGGTKWLAVNCGVDVMYLDSTVMPELTANALDDMAWTDNNGRLHGTYPVWACRNFLERLYILLHCEIKKDGGVDLHDPREPLYFINSFADTTVSGEGSFGKGKNILETFSPDEFATYYMTHSRGDMRRFIWWNWSKLPIYENQMQSMLLLHDVGKVADAGTFKYHGNKIGYDPKIRQWVRLRKLREHYDGAMFVPYWQGRIAALEPEIKDTVMASAWTDTSQKRALVVISNLGTKPWNGKVKLNLNRLGVDNNAQLADAMFNIPLKYIASDNIPMNIPPQSYRLLLVNDQLPLPTNAKLDGTQKQFGGN